MLLVLLQGQFKSSGHLSEEYCPWCSHGAYMVVPVKSSAEEGSDVGAMGEDGW